MRAGIEYILSLILEQTFVAGFAAIGIIGFLGGILALLFANVSTKAILGMAQEKEYDLSLLNIEDDVSIRKAFDNVDIVLKVARAINADPAETLEMFKLHVHNLQSLPDLPISERTGALPSSVWQRLSIADEPTLREVFEERRVVRAVAEKLGERPSTNFDVFREQVRRLNSISSRGDSHGR